MLGEEERSAGYVSRLSRSRVEQESRHMKKHNAEMSSSLPDLYIFVALVPVPYCSPPKQ